MSDSALVTELAGRLTGIAIISSDISDGDIEGQDNEALVAKITSHFEAAEKPALLTKEILIKIIGVKEEVQPKVEIIRSKDFKPLSKDVESRYSIRSVDVEKTVGTVADFTHYFNDRLQKLREFIHSGQASRLAGMMKSIDSLKQYTN